MNSRTDATVDRRGFLKTAGAGLTAATAMLTSPEHAMAAMLTSREQAIAQTASEKARLDRLASCTWPIRQIFKSRAGAGRGRANAPDGAGQAAGGGRQAGAGTGQPAGRNRMTSAQMKEKYGEITMLDFPQFTKDTFPGVTRMDIRSGLFGDVTDDSMFVRRGIVRSVERVGPKVAGQARREDWWRPARRSSTSRTTRPRTWPIRRRCAAEGRRRMWGRSGWTARRSSAPSPCG